jgi:hypothetical protein
MTRSGDYTPDGVGRRGIGQARATLDASGTAHRHQRPCATILCPTVREASSVARRATVCLRGSFGLRRIQPALARRHFDPLRGNIETNAPNFWKGFEN